MGEGQSKMSTELSGVDALAEVRRILEENRDAVKAERLNATSRMFVDVMIAVTRGPSRADGWLRVVDEIRQLAKLMIALDGADADRKLAEVLEQLDELQRTRSKTSSLVQ